MTLSVVIKCKQFAKLLYTQFNGKFSPPGLLELLLLMVEHRLPVVLVSGTKTQ